MTKLLQCRRDELVRRDYAASTIRSYIQIAALASLAAPRLRATPDETQGDRGAQADEMFLAIAHG